MEDLQFIKSAYGLNLTEDQIFYNESISDFSWSDSLLVFKDEVGIWVIDECSNTPRLVTQDEALNLMLEFEQLYRTPS